MTQSFDEIHVYESVAERTGNRVELSGIRGRVGVCRSLSELGSKCRRLGDGYYYLATAAWPGDEPTINLGRTWQPLA